MNSRGASTTGAATSLPPTDTRLLNFLVRRGRLSTEQAVRAEEHAAAANVPIVEALVACNVTSEQQLAETLASALHLPVVDLSTILIDEAVTQLVDEAAAIRFGVMPVSSSEAEVTLAMSNPLDFEAVKHVGFTTGRHVRQVVATRSQVFDAIGKCYRLEDALGTLLTEIPDAGSLRLVHEGEGKRCNGTAKSADSPVVKMVNLIFLEALADGASDIHIEPGLNVVQVRCRINGVLETSVQFPKWIHNFIVGRIKIMADLDIAERRVPQDGHLRLVFKGREVDVRVSSLPTKLGEKVVLRLLDPGRSVRSIEQIGLSLHDRDVLRAAVRNPEGMILVTGPTGSGKTTTLYALLREILCDEVNIVTIENPIEYQLEGIAQVQVHEKSGLTFAAALRSILRQDPDVILLGEIRDRETAEVAFQAAQTGHLVLSTLHTNDSVATITRLLDLGIEPYLLASSLIAVVAQRLVRTVCPRCSEASIPDARTRELFGLSADESVPRGRGCPACRQGGWGSRTGIYEVVEVTDQIRHLVETRSPESAIRALACQQGTVTLIEDAVAKIRNGVTAPEEVLRVTQVERRGPRCPSCSAPVEDAFTVCPVCAHELKRSCASCGTPLKREWNQCPYCAEVAAAPATSGDSPLATIAEFPPGTSANGGKERTRPPGSVPHEPGNGIIEVPLILVVDDHEDIRRIVGWSLRKAFGRVELDEAADGLEALEKIKARPPHLIVLDIMMPGLDGVEVCRRIRADLKHALIPIIMLTGKSDQESKRLGFLAGTDDFLVKPFQRVELCSRVQRLLERTYGFRPTTDSARETGAAAMGGAFA